MATDHDACPHEPYITTFSGRKMYFLNPTPDMVDIEDIAHALSHVCRFGGHTANFYSVAQHSLSVAAIAENRLEGLLHDASEAYLVDIPKPIKGHLTSYKDIETKIMEAIAAKLGAGWPVSEDTHDADLMQLKMEAKYLVTKNDWRHLFPTRRTHGVIPHAEMLSPKDVKGAFLVVYNQLKANGNAPLLDTMALQLRGTPE